MKVELESTRHICDAKGVPARLWHGQTGSGCPITALIALIGVAIDAAPEHVAEFERELLEQPAQPGLDSMLTEQREARELLSSWCYLAREGEFGRAYERDDCEADRGDGPCECIVCQSERFLGSST